MGTNHIQVVIHGGDLVHNDPTPDTRIYVASVMVDDDSGRFLAEAEARIRKNINGILVDVAALQREITDSNLLLQVVAEIRKVAKAHGLI